MDEDTSGKGHLSTFKNSLQCSGRWTVPRHRRVIGYRYHDVKVEACYGAFWVTQIEGRRKPEDKARGVQLEHADMNVDESQGKLWIMDDMKRHI